MAIVDGYFVCNRVNYAPNYIEWLDEKEEPAALPLRPVIKWFAEQMEATLKKNDHKTGWVNDDWDELYDRLIEEAKELYAVCGKFTKDKSAIVGEATDVANFAMMIADRLGNQIGQSAAVSATKEEEHGELWEEVDIYQYGLPSDKGSLIEMWESKYTIHKK